MAKHTWTDFAVLEPSTPQFKDGKKVEWKVQVNEEGQFRCSCPSYIFSKQTPKTCKHCKRCEQEQLNGKQPVAATPGVQRPVVAPCWDDANAMFAAMCDQASKHAKVRFNVRDQIGKEASKIMIDVLAARLQLFNPAKAVVVADAAPVLGVRRITFDD